VAPAARAPGRVLRTGGGRPPRSPSVLAPAGGLVFEGARDRQFRALDSATGKALWSWPLNAAPSSTPITYAAHGKQYVAVVAGGGNPHDITWREMTPEITDPADGVTLYVFELPGAKG